MDAAQKKEMGELFAMLTENKVRRMKFADGIEVEMDATAFAPQAPAETVSPTPIGVEHGGEPTDEQLMEWSTGLPLPAALKDEAS